MSGFTQKKEVLSKNSPKKQKAIVALLTTKALSVAAQEAGVSERTLRRWLKDDREFQGALKAAEAEVLNDAVRRLTGAADSSITVVLMIMLQSSNPAGVRLRAALSVLEQLIRFRELNTLEERLDRLEEQILSGEQNR